MECPGCGGPITIEVEPTHPLSASVADALLTADRDEQIVVALECNRDVRPGGGSGCHSGTVGSDCIHRFPRSEMVRLDSGSPVSGSVNHMTRVLVLFRPYVSPFEKNPIPIGLYRYSLMRLSHSAWGTSSVASQSESVPSLTLIRIHYLYSCDQSDSQRKQQPPIPCNLRREAKNLNS